MLARQPVVVVKERLGICRGREAIHRRINQDPRLSRSQLRTLFTGHDGTPAGHHDGTQGGPDTVGKLRRHAERTARAWALDGRPLFGISVFAVLDVTLDDLLRRRFTSFRAVHMPSVGRLADGQFELLPTGRRPHFTVRLQSADDSELDRLLAALGAAQPNPQYARGMIWREEG